MVQDKANVGDVQAVARAGAMLTIRMIDWGKIIAFFYLSGD